MRDNKSNYDLSIAGVKLIDAQVRALVTAVQHNTTLKILSMNRKKINDDDGSDMIRILCANVSLERVDLEGNNLGPKTARAVAELLRNNKMLKHLNLESNNLTNLYKDNEGIFELAKVNFSKENAYEILGSGIWKRQEPRPFIFKSE